MSKYISSFILNYYIYTIINPLHISLSQPNEINTFFDYGFYSTKGVNIMLTHSKIFTGCILIFLLSVPVSYAQTVLFDFDNAPLFTSLPIYQTAGGITAHLSATGQGYSIQYANVLGFTPQGFAGHIIYPNSIYLADLLVHFDQPLTDFSIMYCCQELGCDDAATMRVTAYMNGSYVGFSTRTATFPGTWPVDTLSCSFPQGFDSVVVHYLHPPPTCQDYGTIFMADNMRVTPSPNGVIKESEIPVMFRLNQNYPNPFNPETMISYQIAKQSYITLKVFDVLGREVAVLVNGVEQAGYKSVNFNADKLVSGVYFYQLRVGNEFSDTKKMLLIK
jgi:hypothetical protein